MDAFIGEMWIEDFSFYYVRRKWIKDIWIFIFILNSSCGSSVYFAHQARNITNDIIGQIILE